MYDKQAVAEGMARIIAPNGNPITDADQMDRHLKQTLEGLGYNPDDVFDVGTMLMLTASATGETPETAVVSAFTVGVALGSLLKAGEA